MTYDVDTDVKPPATSDELEKRRLRVAIRVATLRVTDGILAQDIADEAGMSKATLSLTLSGEKARTLEDKLNDVEAAIDRILARNADE